MELIRGAGGFPVPKLGLLGREHGLPCLHPAGYAFGAKARVSVLASRRRSDIFADMEETCQILAIYLSPGHNFFGRHNQTALAHEILSVPEVDCVAGSGLVGDRFFDHKRAYKGQVTFFSREVFDTLCEGLGLCEMQPAVLRRNVLTSGVDLNTLIGRTFSIQGVVFEGTEECRPCYWMDAALAPGAEEALRGRGGLRARILEGGTLRVDG